VTHIIRTTPKACPLVKLQQTNQREGLLTLN